jgi:hypothetical protein
MYSKQANRVKELEGKKGSRPFSFTCIFLVRGVLYETVSLLNAAGYNLWL